MGLRPGFVLCRSVTLSLCVALAAARSASQAERVPGTALGRILYFSRAYLSPPPLVSRSHGRYHNALVSGVRPSDSD